MSDRQRYVLDGVKVFVGGLVLTIVIALLIWSKVFLSASSIDKALGEVFAGVALLSIVVLGGGGFLLQMMFSDAFSAKGVWRFAGFVIPYVLYIALLFTVVG